MKVLVIGSGPWPLEPGAVVTGPSIRLRQFVEPLVRGKHEVMVAMLEDQPRRGITIGGTLGGAAFPPEEILDPQAIAGALDLQFVGAVFGVGSLMPAVAACRVATHLNVPCWVDFFGDPMAELHAAQLRQGGTPDTTARDHVWKFVREALLRGDMFSSVSAPQRHALLGQLDLLGRYANHWDVCRRLHEIPCAVPESWTEPAERPPFPEVLRERGLGEGTRYVFFGGSWNVWLDESTMARALERALEDDASLHFVSSGIPTGRAGEQIHTSLMRPLERFRAAGRLHDLGPMPAGSEATLLAHAGACLSLDRAIPEAELGSRNRLLAMVRYGARPVVTIEAGVETLLVAEGLAAGIDTGDAERAAREIIAACARTPERREEDRRAGQEWLRTVTFGATLQPVLAWIAQKTPRWPETGCDGLLDRWANFPAEPESLFGAAAGKKKKNWLFR